MPQAFKAPTLRECYRRAAQAKHLAETTADPGEKDDLLKVEQRWLELAHSVEDEIEFKAGW
jgi:hypothetical protein